MSRRFSPLAWLAALALLTLSMLAAPARSEAGEGVYTWNCFGTRGSRTCTSIFRKGRIHPHVINVQGPASPEEVAAAEARDRRWAERCDPVIRQDRYGMPRYTYGAPGCEYGRLD
jgi:hypothetical protein